MKAEMRMNMKFRWGVVWRRTAVCLAFAAIAALGIYQYRQEVLAESLSDKIIRFHVLANSDSRRDQQLKLKVRDAVGSYMHQELADTEDADESRAVILRNMEHIAETAKTVIREEGYSYGVTASLTRAGFPRKTYGAYTFPEGEYEALQLIIGQGKGKNWWCVMYPNMCFRDSVYEVIEEDAEKSLQKVLTTEEYKAIMENGDYEVKFRWLSFLN